jgi:hypothetical protein
MTRVSHLISVLEQLSADASRAHRDRRYPRVGVRMRVSVIPFFVGDAGFLRISGWMRDLSIGGAGFLLPRSIKRETPLLLECVDDDDRAMVMPYGVVTCDPRPAGQYEVGARMLARHEIDPIRTHLAMMPTLQGLLICDVAVLLAERKQAGTRRTA